MPALSYDPPPFFKRGPSPFARFVFFSLLSLALLFADGRYGYLESLRVGFAVVLDPLQRVALLPLQAWDVVAAYFANQTRLSAENKQLRQQLLAQGAVVQSAQSLVQVHLPGLREDQPGSGTVPCDRPGLGWPEPLGDDLVREVRTASAAEPPS